MTAEAGTPVTTLMERAGYAVADMVEARSPRGARILFLAGPGNNGGDAFVAAQVLRERGYQVGVADLSGGAGAEAAQAANAGYHGPRLTVDDVAGFGAAVIVDGLFGGGLSRNLSGAMARVVEAVNDSGARVFAIDLPSGIDGASGAVRGVAIRADRTMTFQRRRPGHLLLPGRSHCGVVEVADIGIATQALAEVGVRTFANEPPLWRAVRPCLADAGHKYERGHAVVVSGPMTQTGAARLAAMAALRAGAGLVTVASPADALMVNAAHLTAVMLARVDGGKELAAFLEDRRRNVVCLGPGLPPDEGTRDLVAAALAAPAAAVVDAGALTAFAGDGVGLGGLTLGGNAILTPHEGEFSRVFGGEGDKLSRARRAAGETGAVILLKGSDTVIAAPDGRAAINANAPPWLATAGSGDVLAGIITAFVAEGVPAFEAAAMGAFLHGEVANRLGPALIAEDLVAGLSPARAAFEHL